MGKVDSGQSVQEMSIKRLMIGPLDLLLHSSAVHRILKMVACAMDHEYEPYYTLKPGDCYTTVDWARYFDNFVLIYRNTSRVLFLSHSISLYVYLCLLVDRCGGGEQGGSTREWERLGRIYPNTADVCHSTEGLHYCLHGGIQPVTYTTSCCIGPEGTILSHTYTHIWTHITTGYIGIFCASMFFPPGFGCAVDYYTVPSSEATACNSYAGREGESGAFCTNVWHRAHPHCQQPQHAFRQPPAPLLHTLLSEGSHSSVGIIGPLFIKLDMNRFISK